jgi:hypothetical protein
MKISIVAALSIGFSTIITENSGKLIESDIKPREILLQSSRISNTDKLQDKQIESILEGVWQKEEKNNENLGCGDKIKISLNSQVENFCIIINQAYVTVKYEFNNKKKEVYLLFVTTNTLGKEGAKLPWQDYDRKKPIAIIYASNASQGRIQVKWNGFYYKKQKIYHKHGEEYEGTYIKVSDKVE